MGIAASATAVASVASLVSVAASVVSPIARWLE
jgi:hypothetical protein